MERREGYFPLEVKPGLRTTRAPGRVVDSVCVCGGGGGAGEQSFLGRAKLAWVIHVYRHL